MHKLRVHSALGRGRPTASPVRIDNTIFPLRQFHISAIRSQEDETQVPQNTRQQRNQSITRLTQSLSKQAAPLPLIRRVDPHGRSPIDARNLAASPPTSAARNFKPEQQRSLRESLTRQPQRPPPKRREPQEARHQGPTKRQPRIRGDDDDLSPTSFSADSNEEIMQFVQDMVSKEHDELAARGEPSEYEPPAEISLESLTGYGPRLSVGKFGMVEVVGDRVRGAVGKLERERERREVLSKAWTEGENYKYRSKDEREAVEHLVQKAQRGPQGEGEEDKGDLLTSEQRDQLVERLFRGSYTIGGKEGGAFGELRRKLDVNGSYLPKDGEKLVKKVRALMPGQGGEKGKRARA